MKFRPAAIAKLIEFRERCGIDGAVVYIKVNRLAPVAEQFQLEFAPQESMKDTAKLVLATDPIGVISDVETREDVRGVVMDYRATLWSQGFVFEGWDAKTAAETQRFNELQELIAQKVMPVVQQHGGSVTLAGVKDENVYVRLGGACSSCRFSQSTVQGVVLKLLQSSCDWVQAVVEVDEFWRED